MQEIVDESADIEIRPESQHNPGHQSDFAETIYKISLFLWLQRNKSEDGEVPQILRQLK
jgi:hypothetical protein